MSTTNTSWDDTGFDDEGDGGFKAEPSKETPSTMGPLHHTPSSVEPLKTTHGVENTSPFSDEAEPYPNVEPTLGPPPPPAAEPTPMQQYTRVEPRAVPTPPVPEKRSRWGTVFMVLAGLLIVMAGGYIVSTFFLRDEQEQEAFYGSPETEQAADVSQQPVDTVAVVSETDIARIADSIKVDSISRLLLSDVPTKPSAPRVPREPRATTPKPAAKERAEKPEKTTTPADALFVVQVFSSPSRDDADEWLQILRERSVADGFITEQKLGGEKWYRVRFGQYGTRKDAEAAAQQLGFSNPWIARVR